MTCQHSWGFITLEKTQSQFGYYIGFRVDNKWEINESYFSLLLRVCLKLTNWLVPQLVYWTLRWIIFYVRQFYKLTAYFLLNCHFIFNTKRLPRRKWHSLCIQYTNVISYSQIHRCWIVFLLINCKWYANGQYSIKCSLYLASNCIVPGLCAVGGASTPMTWPLVSGAGLQAGQGGARPEWPGQRRYIVESTRSKVWFARHDPSIWMHGIHVDTAGLSASDLWDEWVRYIKWYWNFILLLVSEEDLIWYAYSWRDFRKQTNMHSPGMHSHHSHILSL